MIIPFSWVGTVYTPDGGGGGIPTATPAEIQGSTALGGTLSVFLPGGQTPVGYQWRRNGVSIAGATGATYTITLADSNTSISVWVTCSINAVSVPLIPDVSPPTLVSAAVQDTTRNRAEFLYNEALDSSSIPATSAYTFPGKTTTGVSISGATVLVTVNNAWAPGDVITGTYTVPGTNRVQDLSGNDAAAFTGQAIVNNTVAPGDFSTFADGLYDPSWQPNWLRDAKTQAAFSLPAKSTNILTGGYRDAAFDSECRVVTAVTDVGSASNDSAVHEYSRKQAYNADSSHMVIQSRNGFWWIINTTTNAVVNMGGAIAGGIGALPGFAGDCEGTWHPTDPNLIAFTSNGGGMVWWVFDIVAKSQSVLFDLTTIVRARAGMSTATRTWWKAEGRPSNDWNRWGLSVEGPSGHLGIVMYDKPSHTIVGSFATTNNPNWVSGSPLGNYIVTSYYGSSAGSLAAETARAPGSWGGPHVFPADCSSQQALSCIGEHSDMAIDSTGNEVYVSLSLSPGDALTDGCVYFRRLSNPSIVTELPINVFQGSTGAQIHISGCATRRPGWVLVNKSPGVGSGPHDGQVLAAELHPSSPRVARLFHHRAIGGDQFASPVATVNNDFTRVLAHSQNAGGGNVDLCCILPSWALPTAGATAPVNTVAPSVTGASNPGGTLTRVNGTYTGLPTPTIAGVWQQSANGTTGWTDISGQTSANYIVAVANGIYVSWLDTATNSNGSTSVRSNVMLVQALAAPVNTVAPSSPTSGTTDTITTAVAGTWTGNPAPSIAFVWQRNISGTWTDSALTTRAATLTPVGDWRPKETATNSQGSATATGATCTVTAPAAEPVPSTTITFNQANGTTLETINAAWEGTTRYQVQSSTLQNMDPFAGGSALAYLTLAGGTNQAVQTTMVQPTDMAGAPDRLLHLHLHSDNTTDGYRCEVGETQVRLYRAADSSPIFGPVDHGVNVATTNITIKFTQLGGRLRVYINGSSTAVADYTDGSPLTGGYCGIQFYPGATSTRIKLQNFLYGSA